MRRLPVLNFLFSKISGLEEIKVKIKYEFADGTVSEVEVEESIGAVIIEDRRLEDNLARKERYHCHSLDAVEFEGVEYGTHYCPHPPATGGLPARRLQGSVKIMRIRAANTHSRAPTPTACANTS